MARILIVEDDPLTAKMYGDFLRRGGYEVDIAPDGLAGVAQLQVAAPDGMLVDLMMPKMNGIDFIKQVRQDERFKNIPVLAYTTAFVPHMIEQATDAGATEVFDKSKLNGTLIKNAFQMRLALKPEGH